VVEDSLGGGEDLPVARDGVGVVAGVDAVLGQRRAVAEVERLGWMSTLTPTWVSAPKKSL
jgi:hypothetical protein